ncbi:hypothetical protein MAPG_08971 [Magnaporthiopsis poae ATCC 64411]|uniref:Uncharacterized protein n=1 Tax=Magnaporthiopsis poae (strain ATCC 64411 / 73-15) TaxID=644358 RepID=A0A0C4E8Q5_MAGP6|nr:hypothetical protein MAPG_08971 [Magnaporthiopsis poae ATCC 64411]
MSKTGGDGAQGTKPPGKTREIKRHSDTDNDSVLPVKVTDPSRKEGQGVCLPPLGFQERSQASFCSLLDDKPFKIAVRQPEACAFAFIVTDEGVWYATWCGFPRGPLSFGLCRRAVPVKPACAGRVNRIFSTSMGRRLLRGACKSSDATEAKMLVAAGARCDSRDSQGRTPVDVAASNGRDEVLEVLGAAPSTNTNTNATITAPTAGTRHQDARA